VAEMDVYGLYKMPIGIFMYRKQCGVNLIVFFLSNLQTKRFKGVITRNKFVNVARAMYNNGLAGPKIVKSAG
jgi:hypothetical protein